MLIYKNFLSKTYLGSTIESLTTKLFIYQHLEQLIFYFLMTVKKNKNKKVLKLFINNVNILMTNIYKN